MRRARFGSIVLLIGLLVGPAGSLDSLAAAGCRAWHQLRTPSIPDGYLTSVAGTASSDVWAVGAKYYAPSQPPILHWNGVAWLGAVADRIDAQVLSDVSADAVNDAWAVGYYGVSGSPIVHWDGVRWRQVLSVSPDYLFGVLALSPNDVWAVGESMRHWDGQAWSLIATSPGVLFDVASTSPTDIWAVGYQGHVPTFTPLAEHWDGQAWTSIPVPSPPGATGNVELRSVTAVTSDDVWAVGYDEVDLGLRPLIEHWDGSAWSVVALVPPPNLILYGVAAASSTDVWAVGGRKNTLHWDGSSWSAVAFGAPPQGSFAAVAAISGTDVWAVGSAVPNTVQPLIEHSSGPCP